MCFFFLFLLEFDPESAHVEDFHRFILLLVILFRLFFILFILLIGHFMFLPYCSFGWTMEMMIQFGIIIPKNDSDPNLCTVDMTHASPILSAKST